MKREIILKPFLFLIFLALTSCSSDDLVEKSLPGEWIEVYPVSDRTILIFTSQNRLTRIDGEGNQEEYTYKIDGDAIILSLNDGQEGSTELYFNKIEPGRFKIGNVYPSIPENEEVIMTFEKKLNY